MCLFSAYTVIGLLVYSASAFLWLWIKLYRFCTAQRVALCITFKKIYIKVFIVYKLYRVASHEYRDFQRLRSVYYPVAVVCSIKLRCRLCKRFHSADRKIRAVFRVQWEHCCLSCILAQQLLYFRYVIYGPRVLLKRVRAVQYIIDVYRGEGKGIFSRALCKVLCQVFRKIEVFRRVSGYIRDLKLYVYVLASFLCMRAARTVDFIVWVFLIYGKLCVVRIYVRRRYCTRFYYVRGTRKLRVIIKLYFYIRFFRRVGDASFKKYPLSVRRDRFVSKFWVRFG